jgi:hypothetical protein
MVFLWEPHYFRLNTADLNNQYFKNSAYGLLTPVLIKCNFTTETKTQISKTMKTIYKTSILMVLVIMTLAACSKKDTPKPATDISLVAGSWVTNQWGGVAGDDLTFSVDKASATGTVTAITGGGYGFTVGTVIFSNIKPNTDGTYSCSGSYNPTGGGGLLTRNATMSLQNNNTQLTVYYPALNASYPAITYVYQKSSGGITQEGE